MILRHNLSSSSSATVCVCFYQGGSMQEPELHTHTHTHTHTYTHSLALSLSAHPQRRVAPSLSLSLAADAGRSWICACNSPESQETCRCDGAWISVSSALSSLSPAPRLCCTERRCWSERPVNTRCRPERHCQPLTSATPRM